MNATKVNAGPAESNGKLLLGIWRDSLHVTCGLTACTPGSAPGPTLGNEYGKTFTFLYAVKDIIVLSNSQSIQFGLVIWFLPRDAYDLWTMEYNTVFHESCHIASTRTNIDSYYRPFGWVKITSIDNGGCALVFGWVQRLLGLVEFGCENLLYNRSVIGDSDSADRRLSRILQQSFCEKSQLSQSI